MKKILCIEDAADMRIIVKSALPHCEVLNAVSLLQARALLEAGGIDLILLDIEMPDGDGLEMLSHYQMQTGRAQVPVIVLTGKRTLSSKTAAFSIGADDYMEKPFDPGELKLRVDARIRKAEKARQASETKHVGDLILNVSEQKLMQNGEPGAIDLTSLEFRLFSLLAKAPDQVYTRDALIAHIWGENISITARTVDTHIAHLRKKIVKSQVKIETVFGTGYKLKAS